MKIVLRGWRTFDAAVFCAAVAAGRRYALPAASSPTEPFAPLPTVGSDAVPCPCLGRSVDEPCGQDSRVEGSGSTASVSQSAAITAQFAATVAASAAQPKLDLMAQQ